MKQHCTRTRPCPACGMKRPASGHDPCIPNRQGVEYACCGHGKEPGYIRFLDGRTIKFVMTAVDQTNRLPNGELDLANKRVIATTKFDAEVKVRMAKRRRQAFDKGLPDPEMTLWD